MNRSRNNRAATLIFVLVGCFVLLLLIVAFFKFGLIFGGSQETRNASDAGALNIAQEIQNVRIPAQGKNELQFEDVADSKGTFGPANINRVWAKALLVNLNVKAMDSSPFASDSARVHADEIYNGCKSLSDRLSQQVQNKETLRSLFNAIASENSTQMLGKDTVVRGAKDDSRFRTSCLDRAVESNIVIADQSLPTAEGSAALKPVKATDAAAYLPGYVPVECRAHKFFFIPYKAGEKPHLVSLLTFDKNTAQSSPIDGWEAPIPNSFSGQGEAGISQASKQMVVSCAQANPQRTFKLTIPHGFVRIKLVKNTVTYRVNGTQREQGEYGFFQQPPESKSFPDGLGVGTVTATATLGLEYVPGTLWQAINAIPGNHQSVIDLILQRCREFKPDTSEAELTKCLQSCNLSPQESEYLIYPLGDDKVSLSLTAQPAGKARSQSSWIKADARPDGKEAQVAGEYNGPVAVPMPAPNTALVTLSGPGVPVYLPSFVTELGNLSWTAGSGYDQCLGELKISRETIIDADGFVQAVAPL